MAVTLVPAYSDGVPDTEYNPNLMANLVARLVLCPIALLASWVPFRLLQKNGEFAAATMTATNWILVLIIFINAAIWNHDDIANMWPGEGWADFVVYTYFPLTTIYGACTCAITRRLAKQVDLSRVAGLTDKEKRNNLIVQILIIFPVALLQLALTPLVQETRYFLFPITGPTGWYQQNIVYFLFYMLPTPLYTLAASFHACMCLPTDPSLKPNRILNLR